MYVDQDLHIDELKHIKQKSDQASQKDELLSKEEIKAVRAIVGHLSWISSNTCPDIAFDSCTASNYRKSPTVKYILTVDKTVDKVKRTSLTIKDLFPDLSGKMIYQK